METNSYTGDVTFTKIAGYVRIRILMNRSFFHIFGIHTFYATATFYTPGTHALNTCGRHLRSFSIGWRPSKQCWGVTAGKPRHNSSNVRGVTAGKMGRNSSSVNYAVQHIIGAIQVLHNAMGVEGCQLSVQKAL